MADQPLDTSTRLAAERTRLASERTLMAWIRTSTSLIAFGFTIFKFFQWSSLLAVPFLAGFGILGSGESSCGIGRRFAAQDPERRWSLEHGRRILFEPNDFRYH